MITPLGKKIRQLRKEMGLTLEQLAELSKSSKSYIWELENKDPPRPSAEKVAAIASALNVTADYLLGNSPKAPDVDVLDQAFFRDYQGLGNEDKERLRSIVKGWKKNG